MNNDLYDEDYFERGIELGKSCYTDYRWLPELTIRFCTLLLERLGIKEGEKILDFGCAKGYMVRAFRLLHYDAYGYDISKYAIENCHPEVKNYITLIKNEKCIKGSYDWVVSKDVFEHISYEDITRYLNVLRKVCKNMFCIIPLGNGEKFIVPADELDVTHIIRESLEWWCMIFEECGFDVVDTSYKIKGVKENWTEWEEGYGFFILGSN
jgi:SAM-dependent methyltransferase